MHPWFGCRLHSEARFFSHTLAKGPSYLPPLLLRGDISGANHAGEGINKPEDNHVTVARLGLLGHLERRYLVMGDVGKCKKASLPGFRHYRSSSRGVTNRSQGCAVNLFHPMILVSTDIPILLVESLHPETEVARGCVFGAQRLGRRSKNVLIHLTLNMPSFSRKANLFGNWFDHGCFDGDIACLTQVADFQSFLQKECT